MGNWETFGVKFGRNAHLYVSKWGLTSGFGDKICQMLGTPPHFLLPLEELMSFFVKLYGKKCETYILQYANEDVYTTCQV